MRPDDFDDLTRRFVERARADDRIVAVIALGSTAGRGRAPDEWSDHDLWFVTVDGQGPAVREDQTLVPDHERVVVRFAETEHGRSVIYDDGHLVEYAVFDESELDIAGTNAHAVPYDERDITARMTAIEERTRTSAAATDPHGQSRFGSLCAQLTIGVTRAARGESMSANFMLRGQAVASLTWLVGRCVPPPTPAADPVAVDDSAPRGAAEPSPAEVSMIGAQGVSSNHRLGVLDSFDPHRRFERVHPSVAAEIDRIVRLAPVEVAAGLLDLAERTLSGHVEGATPAAFAAVRANVDRARAAVG